MNAIIQYNDAHARING